MSVYCRKIKDEGKERVVCDLALCLEAISGDDPLLDLDKARLISLIVKSLAMEPLSLPIRMEATRNGFKIGEILSQPQIKAFRTKQADCVAVDYTITMQLEVDQSVIRDERIDCRMITHGSCYYTPVANSLTGHFIEWITLDWKYPSGGYGQSIRSLGNDDPLITIPRPVTPWQVSDNS